MTLATLKRLINLTRTEDLWLFVGMTPDAVGKTRMLDPALWERFIAADGTYQFQVSELTASEAKELVTRRLASAREGMKDVPSLFPFPDNLFENLTPATYSSPRRLVRFCFYALSQADGISVPFSSDYLKQVEMDSFPTESDTNSSSKAL
jgi:hypothetical protein